MISILIADNQLLTYEGIVAILSAVPEFAIAGKASNYAELEGKIIETQPDIIVIDHHQGDDLETQFAKNVRINFNHSRILILSNRQDRTNIEGLMALGVQNYLSKACTREELIQAVFSTARGESFFCDTTKQTLLGGQSSEKKEGEAPTLSVRETEIVHLIADGLPNKDIADKLFLSVHTVKTHRKNIIKKLGFSFKNAAELVLLINYLNDNLI